MATNNQKSFGLAESRAEHWLDLVRQQVGSLNFGLVQIVVHDSQVVQIERTEKLRLDKPEPKTAPLSSLRAGRNGGVEAASQEAQFHQ